ncbi:MAG: protein TolQ, partial [Methylobacterium sp.]|nr:protein TolQ [Methylobacterium sp.]
SWAIILNKSIAMRSMAKSMDEFEDRFWSGQSLDELYRGLVNKTNDGFAALFIAAMTEWRRAFEGSGRGFASLQTRIDKVLDVSIAREVERLESKLLALATIASVGPYIGLFGTVFGIMTTFRSIAASKNTSLAVVAPGIAEALFATAIALAAAIPANIFYNKFVRDAGKIQGRLESFADEFSAILSRQIDERAGTVQNRGAA